MTALQTEVVPAAQLTASDTGAMLAIMQRVYDGVDPARFKSDLAGKDEVIVLRAPDGELAGFSTQQIVRLPGEKPVTGVFSGDTVIAPEHWGSPALFQAFARHYVFERAEPWYWFLICKGHRTYRMLPTFFNRFWPNRHEPTPPGPQAIMDAYAIGLYGADYCQPQGVLSYSEPKDRLREGVAGVTEALLRVPDIAFFVERNPGYPRGDDLVCLTVLTPDNLRPAHRARLLGSG